MADSPNTTTAPEIAAERAEHPVDSMSDSLRKLEGLLNVIKNDFEEGAREPGGMKQGYFRTPSHALFESINACFDLAKNARKQFDRLPLKTL